MGLQKDPKGVQTMDSVHLSIDRITLINRARWWPSAAAVLLAGLILYGVGFAHHDALHHAAHDTRHSAAFPCH
ncbi:MAG: hypothetical protein Ct9H300mP16_19060 [Pseudomonadota bacterium]|jgi:cobalt transporter subunit CbtB|nr:MAG: hypothetical protein Ct9H300mP16_19060 [Pseudomonadota bacterium]|tara:strand:- start:639 stop:857 length:219 start_codon:yes stop_codon:yes gene_type:complete